MAMRHLQQITESGEEPEPEVHMEHDYSVETEPIQWTSGNAEEHYDIISEISRYKHFYENCLCGYNLICYRGEFSAVMKAVGKTNNKVVIAKILENTPERSDHIEGEFAALRSLRHERVASLLAAYKTPQSPVAVFILEKLQGADVLTYLASKHEYTEQTVATIVSQVILLNNFRIMMYVLNRIRFHRFWMVYNIFIGEDCVI